MISFDQKACVVQGRRIFLYGAECHYFRIDPERWADRLRLIRQAGFNLVSTYVPWIWHEFSEGDWDFDGRTHPRRDLCRFVELCEGEGLFCIVRPGPYVMSELKNEGIPEWLLRDHPEVIAQTPMGNIHPARVVSYRHPVFLQLVERWYAEVNRRVVPHLVTNGGSIIMYQLDNETGMLHWVTNTPDHNPETLLQFEQYLESVYPSVETFNMVWGTEAATHSEWVAGLPRWRGRPGLAAHWVWASFCREYLAGYVADLRRFAREQGVDVPLIINVHGFKDFSIYSRGTDYPIGLSQLRDAARVPDVILAGDFYPGRIGYDNAHDLIVNTALTEALGNPAQPVFSAEFQSGRLSDRPRVTARDLRLITRLCVAHGMNALNYYMFCGGDNPEGIGLFGRRHDWQAPIAPDGSLRPAYEEARHLGQLFRTFEDVLCASHKVVDTYIGFYHPYYCSETIDWDCQTVSSMWSDVASQRENFHFDGMWRLLAAANISFAAVDLAVNKGLNPADMPVLFVAATQYMDEETQERLVEYARAGGRLVIGPRLPCLDWSGESCTVLADALKVGEWTERVGFLRFSVFEQDSLFCHQHLVFANVRPEEGVVFGEDGEVAGFIRPCGAGEVFVLGVGLTHAYDYFLDVIHDVAVRMGVRPHLSFSKCKVFGVERHSEHGSLIFVNNPGDEDVTTTVTRNGLPAFGGHALTIPAGTGYMLPVEYDTSHGIRIEYATWEIVGIAAAEGAVAISLRGGGGSAGVIKLEGATEFSDETGAVRKVLANDQGLEIWLAPVPEGGTVVLRCVKKENVFQGA